jgi:hypothetical protein
MLHANELLGKYEVPTDFDDLKKSFPPQRRPPPGTFEFDGMLWSSSCPDDTPLNQVPTIANKYYAAKLPPEVLGSKGHQEPVGCTASFDHLGRRGTPEALPKFPDGSNDMEQRKGHQGIVSCNALFDHPGRRGMPEALLKFTNESDALNKTKSPAPGLPSTPMAKKPTPQWHPKSTAKWHTKSPALGHPSALMVSKSTTEWQPKSPASGHPSALMDKPTAEWHTKSPFSGQPSASMVSKSTTE